MTPQEIFDTVAKKLLEQKERSYISGTGCVYRSKDGNKCAVGHLIPDEMYQPWMDDDSESNLDGTGIADLVADRPEAFPDYFAPNIGLLANLQCVHDNKYHWSADRSLMKGRLAEVAADFDLSAAVVQ